MNLAVTLPPEILTQLREIVRSEVHSELQEFKVQNQDDPVISPAETARILGCSLQTVRNYEEKGLLTKHQIGLRKTGYKKSDVMAKISTLKKYTHH
jgi:hypothetical protein